MRQPVSGFREISSWGGGLKRKYSSITLFWGFKNRLHRKPISLTFTLLLVVFSFGNLPATSVGHWIGRVSQHLNFVAGRFAAQIIHVVRLMVYGMYQVYCQTLSVFYILNLILFPLKTFSVFQEIFKGFYLKTTDRNISWRYQALHIKQYHFVHAFLCSSPFGKLKCSEVGLSFATFSLTAQNV